MYKVALVTVLYKCDDVIEGFFKSLSEQTFKDYHLFIVDNSPSDQTDKVIQKALAAYPLAAYSHIKSPGNIGVAAANNVGIKKSLSDKAYYTLILNNDIEFYQKDLLADIVDEADNKKEHIIIPKIYFYNSNKIWMAGGKIMKYRGTSVHIGEGDDDKGQFDSPAYFKYAPTCFMLIHNSVFEKVGIMDEKYFVYYDDTDFVYRAIKAGYRIFYNPLYKVYHKVSFSTGGDESNFSVLYGTRNRIYFINKNFTGFSFLISSTYTLFSKIIKYARYDKGKRASLIQGVKEGFKLLNTKIDAV